MRLIRCSVHSRTTGAGLPPIASRGLKAVLAALHRSASLAVCLGLGVHGAAFADTIVVSPGVPGAINAAIAAANDGDVIQLTAGTYLEGEVIDTQGKELTIAGVSPELGSGVTTIDGADAHRLFQFMNDEGYSTVLRDLRIVNGRHPQGAGLYCEPGAGPRVVNCTFSGHNKFESGWYTIYSNWDFPFCNTSPYLSLQNVFLCDNGDNVFTYRYGCTSDSFNVCERVACDDCDADGVVDGCAIELGLVADCDGNSIPDACDVANGTFPDCNGNLVPDQCESDCDGNGVIDDCDLTGDCGGEEGVPDRDEAPTFCHGSGPLPVDIVFIMDASSSVGGAPALCEDVFDVMVESLSMEFDVRSAWTSVTDAVPTPPGDGDPGPRCHDFTIEKGTPVPVCRSVDPRVIDDSDGEEWGDATALMTNPYRGDLLGQAPFEWSERGAVLILVTISDEGAQNGDDGNGNGACLCDDYDSARNLVQQAWLQNAQVITVPIKRDNFPPCLYDPIDPSSMMQSVADQTLGSVVDAREWEDTAERNTELADLLEDAVRKAIDESPRVVECPCPADLNGDGCVDGGDLGLFLTYWGSSDEFSPGNLDGQAPVNGADLGVLLTAWGVCPGVERCGE